jgi:uncharacterized protein YebE (UPF0316 family)
VFFARLCDVGLGTLRQTIVIRGRRRYAFTIAFFESLIWIYAVSRVISTVQDPLTSVAFALGFASGTFVGMTLEGLFKIGEQVIRIFSRDGLLIAKELRKEDYRVTVFDGSGRDGVVQLLFVQTKRRNIAKATAIARKTDPSCFIVIDDIRSVHAGTGK